MVTSAKVVHMLTRHEDVIHGMFPHIKLPFTTEDVEAFMGGNHGYEIKLAHFDRTQPRSYQIQQAVGAIGYVLVDKGKADSDTHETYKKLWKLQHTDTCAYCKKPFTYTLMMGTNHVCNKLRCQHLHMRESI